MERAPKMRKVSDEQKKRFTGISGGIYVVCILVVHVYDCSY